MQSLTALLAALAVLSSANAHMSLSYPPPFRAAINPFAVQNTIDYSITSPLSPDGSNFPCKGYQSDLGTPGGTSVATWSAGQQYNFTVLGSAIHGGGSCQAALSYDKGVSWKVIHSYQGSCPIVAGESFDFTIPSDAPATSSDGTIFTWLWYNEIGNREIYMSCASVTVNSGSSTSAPATAYSSRPDLFVANLGNGCTTVETKEVQFPNPGPDADVTNKPSVADNSGSFTGTCKAVKGIGGEAGSGSSSSSNSAAPVASGGASTASAVASSVSSYSSYVASSSQQTTLVTSVYSIPGLSDPTSASTLSGGVFATTAAVSSLTDSSAPSAVSTASVPAGTGTSSASGLTVSDDGECSGVHTCEGSIHGPCCSQWGWCGSTDAYCGTGCMEGFGQCGTFLNSTSSTGSAAPTGAKFRFRG